MQPTQPANPAAAVTHANPYPYYARLTADSPFYFDEALHCWVASSAGAVRAVLTSDACCVRPLAEPVPAHILGSPAADIFGGLVRMNDGEYHRTYKPPVVLTLESVDMAQVTDYTHLWAARLLDALNPTAHPEQLTDFNFRLPVYVMASLLGPPDALIPEIEGWVNDYLICLAPGCSQQQLAAGKAAAGELLECFSHPSSGLFGKLAHHLQSQNAGALRAVAANGIGFLTQAYEATAGLMGNTLVALASHEVRQHAPAYLRGIVQETARYDSPVQNTRRFAAHDFVFDGQQVKTGDTILVVLAAANRDPAANPNPHQFDCFRPGRQLFTFGLGLHACPGEHLAVAIATAGLEQLLAAGVQPKSLAERFTYRASINTRIPLFA